MNLSTQYDKHDFLSFCMYMMQIHHYNFENKKTPLTFVNGDKLFIYSVI